MDCRRGCYFELYRTPDQKNHAENAEPKWNTRRGGKCVRNSGRKANVILKEKDGENMNKVEIIRRRIELKKQLIELTKAEIGELEKMAARVASEKRETLTAPAVV